MAEQPIPAPMLDAATKALRELYSRMPENGASSLAGIAQAALEAAGVGALVAELSKHQINQLNPDWSLREIMQEDLRAENATLKAELAKHQESQFHPDWSLLEATRKSLREAWARIAELHATGEHFHSCRECAEAFPCDEGESHVRVLKSAADALREAK